VESYVVDVAADGPSNVIFTAINERGERIFARSADADLMESLLADEDACGRSAQVSDGTLSLR
jgi:hypothetical protein